MLDDVVDRECFHIIHTISLQHNPAENFSKSVVVSFSLLTDIKVVIFKKRGIVFKSKIFLKKYTHNHSQMF